ncbi:MAG: DEAD/DEAH box helicase [Proteobacteria bacterium]|nr:DEAD/DEAH box helicase [Pseudomonadota bacterium]
MQKAKSSIIGHLYEHMDENDWMDGLDIYQAGHVSHLSSMESLITARVSSAAERQPSEVRIKIHPTGGSIQWIECTCRKNRTGGRYCEHIGATMIHIDREKPKVFSHLDPKMPLKPPPTPVRRKTVDPTVPKPEKKANATEAVLSQLEGNIHGVALLANGPQLRVRIEIKPGQLTSYNLELDDAAKFLQEHSQHHSLSPEVKRLKIFETNAILGTKIANQGNQGAIVAQRVIGFPSGIVPVKGRRKAPPGYKCESLSSVDVYVHRSSSETQEYWTQFVSAKSMARHMGKQWIFVEEVGYFPFDSTSVKPAWFELPVEREWEEDDAARLCQRAFKDYLDLGPIWLPPDLNTNLVIENAQFSKVNVLSISADWFSIRPEFLGGDVDISMVDILLEYRKKRRDFMRSGDKWIKVPDLIKQFPWEVDEENRALKVDKLGMIRLKAAMGELDQFAGSKKILDKIREQTEFAKEVPAPDLSQSKLNLRAYQHEGYQWMWWLYKNRLSGLLADEMGLGKTHQSMALMTAISGSKKNAKFLVICPTTVLDHWLDKINDFSPSLSVRKYHGTKRGNILEDLDKTCVTILSSYGIVMRDIDTISTIDWDAVILDEAHFVKNIDTATYKAVCRLKSKSRFCLSGTPMENHLGELKAVYDFLLPGYLGSNDYFKTQYLNPILAGEGREPTANLQKLIHPFKMRRTKNLVLKDLPEKVEDLRHCHLSEEQAEMYRQTLELKAKPLLEIVQDENQSIPYLHIFSVITLLKQICDHPGLLRDKDNWRDHQSGKFELFKELIRESMESGHKVVIYSQYLDMLSIISQHLSDEGIRHESLTGSTRNRGEVIARFQADPEVKVFCASLLAGGIGIDLTAGNVVIHYDRWWNASKENQATDRVHRIGQNKNVQVLKLVSRDTLEEKIDALINRKKELFERFLDRDEEMFKSLTRGEIIELLQ